MRRVLFWAAAAATVLNVLGVGYAAFVAEPMHAVVHTVLALVFGLAAAALREPAPHVTIPDARVNVLEDHISELQRQLDEKQEGLDFAEQLLAKRPEAPKVDPLRYAPKQPDESGLHHELGDEEPK